MSKYAEKKARQLAEKLAASQGQKEPEDEFSPIPEAFLRKYMRARAGMYGATTRKYRFMKIKVEPFVYKRILDFQVTKVIIPINEDNAEGLGELARDRIKNKRILLEVFCEEYGGKIRLPIKTIEESKSPMINIPCLTVVVHRTRRSLYSPIFKRYKSAGVVVYSKHSW